MAETKEKRSGVTATIITKNGAMPGDKLSIPLKKESKQEAVENKNNEMLLTPPYSTGALATLFNENTYHKRCCLVKAGITVRLGFTLYDPNDPNAKPDEEHKKATDFIERHLEEFHDFQLDEEIFGNKYLEVVRNKKKQVSEAYHIAAKDTMLRVENKKRFLREDINGTSVDYIPYMGVDYERDEKERHEYIHIKNYNPENRYYGTPEYSGSIKAMYLDDSAKTYNTNRFSDPVPETLIALADMADDKDTETAIKDFFSSNFGNASKAGRKALLLQFEGAIDDLKKKIHIEKLERDNKDASFRGMRTDNRDEVVSAHGLSPRLIGLESTGRLGGGGEVREQLKLSNELVFIPRKKALARIINMLFIGMGIAKWKIKFNNFEFTNAVEDADYYYKMVLAGILTPDYAAQEQGYPAPNQQGGGISKADKFTQLLKALKGLRTELESMRDE